MKNVINPAVLLKTIFLSYICASQYMPSRSIKLTPFDTIHDTVSVSVLQGVDIINDEWRINPSSNIESNLVINIDPNSKSIVTILINGYSTNSNNMDLIATFNINNNYFSTKISMDNTENNEIFPICDITATPTVNMGIADISSLQFLEIDKISYSDMIPHQFDNNYMNTFPLQFTIQNTANNTFLSYKSLSWRNFAQFCGFQSFEDEYTLKIYLKAVGDNNNYIGITSIDILYTMNGSELISESISEYESETNYILIVLMLSISVCFVILCILYMLTWHKNKNKKKMDNTEDTENTEHTEYTINSNNMPSPHPAMSASPCSVDSDSMDIDSKQNKMEPISNQQHKLDKLDKIDECTEYNEIYKNNRYETRTETQTDCDTSYTQTEISYITDNSMALIDDTNLEKIKINKINDENMSTISLSKQSSPIYNEDGGCDAIIKCPFDVNQIHKPPKQSKQDGNRARTLSDRSETFIPPPPSEVFKNRFKNELQK